jgi:hypothetical protein
MMVKENDRWIAVNSRDEAKIRSYGDCPRCSRGQL